MALFEQRGARGLELAERDEREAALKAQLEAARKDNEALRRDTLEEVWGEKRKK